MLEHALGDLPALQRRLHGCSTVGRLFALAAGEACRACGFERGVILSVDEGRLTADGMDALADPASDALRRRVLADPIPLLSGTEEAELIRRADGARRSRASTESALKEALVLEHHALAVVAPESRPLALLVVDRTDRAVDADEENVVEFFAHMLGLAVERLVLRIRMQEMSMEVRHLTASAQALMREALEGPITLPSDRGHGPAFPDVPIAPPMPEELRELLSEREVDVVRLMVEGHSNREIGERLSVSAETVKSNVARILPKLGASNRVEAVARYLRLTKGGSD